MIKRGTFLLFLFILIPTLVSADCFLLPDSPLYCVDISPEEAESECAIYGCTANYLSDQSCAELDVCQQITCKSSCQLEYKGKCNAGEIPEGKITEWCSSGCCRFSDSCDYKENKWYCEIAARNRDVESFQFQVQTESECQTACENPSLFLAETEPVAPLTIVTAPAISQSREAGEPAEATTLAAEPAAEPTIDFGIVLWLVLGIIVVTGLVLLFSLKKKNVSEIFEGPVEESIIEPQLDTDISASTKPTVDHFKKPMFGRADIFAKFGPVHKETQFEKLQRLSKIQERKVKHRPIPETAFSQLEKRIAKPVKNNKNNQVLQELKKMTKKRT